MWTNIDCFHMGRFMTKLYVGYIGNTVLIKIELWLGGEKILDDTQVKINKKPLRFRLKSLQMLDEFLDKHKAIVKETKEKYFGDFDWKEVEM